jgi:phage gp29-like protein
MELAEAIEERDLHYAGVLGTRRRSVSQLDISVEPGGESSKDKKIAKRVEGWLERDELKDELFDILDALGKGYSFTEIIWDSSSGQWEPMRLEYRDPRWFRFDRADLKTPLQLDSSGQEVPLPGFKFVFARLKAKSGIPLRSGIARIACWSYLFKKFTERDWAIFCQTFGHPVRIGKYGPGASKEDRETLFRAVRDVAGDCAAIIPESMMIDFIAPPNVGASIDLYERRGDWLDKQMSKLVLGQTATTDAVTGGLGSGKEHREVQEDIERADAGQLAAILNRDLIRPWVDLEFGPQKSYPRLKIARPEAEDLAALSSALTPLIGAGLRVAATEIRGRFNLSEPKEGDEILGEKPVQDPQATAPAQVPPQDDTEIAPQASYKHPLNGLNGNSGGVAALQAERRPVGRSGDFDPVPDLTEELDTAATPAMAAIMDQLEQMADAAGSLEELREMVLSGFPAVDADLLIDQLAQAMAAAHAGGQALVEDEADG